MAGVHELTHASFFSGVGGLDLGLERAGWRTVSFSEIDPYASAVLAERWPGVPNLGDITGLVREPAGGVAADGDRAPTDLGRREARTGLPGDSANATLWTGGFPCQDLSVAGKRAGFAGERSSLAFAFLDLVEQYRPPAILLENVPGLLSSNGGRDFGRLLGEVGNLGYWWAYRILDAQFFGVPQRRRRVFICALHAGAGFGADSAAAVLSVGARCGGHSAAGDEAREGVADRLARGAYDSSVPGIYNATAKFGEFVKDSVAGNLSARDYKSSNHLVADGVQLDGRIEEHGLRRQVAQPSRRVGSGDSIPPSSDDLIRPSPDSGGVREADGMAGRLDDREGLELIAGAEQSYHQRDRVYSHIAPPLDATGDSIGDPPIVAYRKSARVNADPDSPESWVDDGLANTLNNFDVGDVRTTHAIVGGVRGADTSAQLLPLGLDSNRYRCCGNGVVSNVTEWIGTRLAAELTQ